MTFTVGPTRGSVIPAGTILALVSAAGAGDSALPFDAARFAIVPQTVSLTAEAPSATFSVVGLVNAAVDGESSLQVEVSVDPMRTTAVDFVRAPIGRRASFVVTDASLAVIVVTQRGEALTDLPGSTMTINVRLTSSPRGPLVVALADETGAFPFVLSSSAGAVIACFLVFHRSSSASRETHRQ